MKKMKWLPCAALVLLAGLVCASCASTPDEATGLTKLQAQYKQAALETVEESPGGIIESKKGVYAVEAFIPMRTGDMEIPYEWATNKIRGANLYSITGAGDYYTTTNFDGSTLRIYNPKRAAYLEFKELVYKGSDTTAYKILCNMMSEMCGLTPVYWSSGIPLRSINVRSYTNTQPYELPTADGFRIMTDELFQSIPDGLFGAVDRVREEHLKLRDLENPYTTLFVIRNIPNDTTEEEK